MEWKTQITWCAVHVRSERVEYKVVRRELTERVAYADEELADGHVSEALPREQLHGGVEEASAALGKDGLVPRLQHQAAHEARTFARARLLSAHHSNAAVAATNAARNGHLESGERLREVVSLREELEPLAAQWSVKRDYDREQHKAYKAFACRI